MRHSPLCRILSVIVSFAIVAVSLPLYAFAADIGDNTPFVAGDAGSVSSNVEIIEVNESRTAAEKTFNTQKGCRCFQFAGNTVKLAAVGPVISPVA